MSEGPELPGVAALAVAVMFVGLGETPPGSNRTPFGAWFGVDGEPWCAIFLSYCFVRGAGLVLCDRFKGEGVRDGKGCAWVPTIEEWAKARGLWLAPTETPVPGDLAIFDWDADGAPEHIGIVERDTGGGEFLTIEGNAGNKVARCRRHQRQLAGLVRVR